MNSNLNEIQWEEIADFLRELNIDFDRRVESLPPKKPRIFPAPSTRPSPGTGIGMTMNLDRVAKSPRGIFCSSAS